MNDLTPIYIPPKYTFFMWEGKRFFNIPGASGGTCNRFICYLVETLPTSWTDLGRHGLHERGNGRWYGIEFTVSVPESSMIMDIIRSQYRHAIKVLDREIEEEPVD